MIHRKLSGAASGSGRVRGITHSQLCGSKALKSETFVLD